jgi:hypothetical protein
MAKRSQDNLTLRQRSTGYHPGHHLSTAPDPAMLSTWLRTHHARLWPPTRLRPYWQVRTRREDRYLAAGRTPTTAITNAIRAASVPPP